MKDHRDVVRYSDTVELIRHELSTPVATALLYIGIAESCVSRLPGDVVMPALRVVRSEVQRLKALIDTMTELQRAGRPTLRPRFMEIGATVRSAAKRLLTTFAGTEGVSIAVPPHGVYGWWDQTAVEQIVTNLLTNALKFGQGGSVRLVVRASGGRRGRASRSATRGSESPRPIATRIFERHEHAPAAQGGGMGLGLWLVRELALAHGGRVTVRSRKGHGSTFTVLLRAQPPLVRAPPPAQVLPRLPPQRSPVRSVSNEPASRGPLPSLLAGPAGAVTGEDGGAGARRGRPALDDGFAIADRKPEIEVAVEKSEIDSRTVHEPKPELRRADGARQRSVARLAGWQAVACGLTTPATTSRRERNPCSRTASHSRCQRSGEDDARGTRRDRQVASAGGRAPARWHRSAHSCLHRTCRCPRASAGAPAARRSHWARRRAPPRAA